MGRLTALGSTLKPLAARVSSGRDKEGHSAAAEPLRHLYSTVRWQRLKRRVHVRDAYQCQMESCGAVTPRPIADHRIPHRGDLALFWDETNVQTLCKPCHDGRKQRLERALR